MVQGRTRFYARYLIDMPIFDKEYECHDLGILVEVDGAHGHCYHTVCQAYIILESDKELRRLPRSGESHSNVKTPRDIIRRAIKEYCSYKFVREGRSNPLRPDKLQFFFWKESWGSVIKVFEYYERDIKFTAVRFPEQAGSRSSS